MALHGPAAELGQVIWEMAAETAAAGATPRAGAARIAERARGRREHARATAGDWAYRCAW